MHRNLRLGGVACGGAQDGCVGDVEGGHVLTDGVTEHLICVVVAVVTAITRKAHKHAVAVATAEVAATAHLLVCRQTQS